MASTSDSGALHQNAPTQFLEAGGVRFAYRRFGAEAGAPPVVFVQHFTGTMDNWDPVLTNRVARDRPVILVDYPGVGRSSGKPGETVSATAKAMIAFIEALGVAQVDLFGFSLGGFVAQQIVVDAPALVRKLVLAGTGPRGGEGMTSWSPRAEAIVADPHMPGGDKLLGLFFAPSETSQAAGKAYLARISERTEDREPAASAEVAVAQLKAIQQWGAGDASVRGYLKKIAQPVLVINGGDDIMVPTVNSFLLQQELPHAQLILYPDAGHGSQFQYAAVCGEEVALFLA